MSSWWSLFGGSITEAGRKARNGGGGGGGGGQKSILEFSQEYIQVLVGL